MASKDLINQVFGRLTVIRKANPDEITSKKKATYWVCMCSCGK